MNRSIRRRLQIWYALVLLATVGGFAAILYSRARASKFEQIDTRLQSAALVLDATLRSFPPHLLDPNRPEPPREPPPFGKDKDREKDKVKGKEKGKGDKGKGGRPPPGKLLNELNLPPELRNGDDDEPYAFAIWRSDDTLLKAAGWPNNQPPASPPDYTPPQVAIYTQDAMREARMMGPFSSVILVARPVGKEQAELAGFTWQLLAAGAGVVIIGFLGGRFVSNQMFRPIAAMSKTAAAISETNLSERIDTTNIDIELGELAKVLNAAFDRLQFAFERQAQFTADASHELRTPLAVIRSSAELALSRQRTPQQYRETLETCLRAVQRMTGITDGLLTLARADADYHSTRDIEIAMDQVVTDAVNLLAPLAGEKGVTIRSDVKPVTLSGNPVALGRIVTNLVGNAVDYNQPGGEVRVSLTNGDKFAVLKVSDTGIGIPSKDLPHVFERFYRVDKDRSRAAGGTGLGLAICQELVASHGGTISVESVMERGTTFEVRLPVGGLGNGRPNNEH